MNKLVFVCQKRESSSGPKILQGNFRARYSFEMCSKKLQVLCTAPQILPNCSTIILRKCLGWSCESEHKSHFKTQLYYYLLLFSFRPQNGCRLPWFLQCFNILSLNCQDLSNHLGLRLFAWMNWKRRLSTTAKYNILYTKRVIVLGLHPVRVSANNTKCHYIGIIGAEANSKLRVMFSICFYSSAWSTSVFGRPGFLSIGCCSLKKLLTIFQTERR